jgi:hypothetical protein
MQANTNDPSALTVILAIWAAVGPLVGIFIGHFLVLSTQRKQWFTDNKVKEWRELLVTLRSSFITMAGASPKSATPDMMKDDLRAYYAASEVLGNRLFIGDEVRKRQVPEKWREAVHALKEDRDPEAFGTRFGEIQHLIEEGARADISKV